MKKKLKYYESPFKINKLSKWKDLRYEGNIDGPIEIIYDENNLLDRIIFCV